MIVPSSFLKHFLAITENMTPVKCLKTLNFYFIYITKIYNMYYKKYIFGLFQDNMCIFVRNIHLTSMPSIANCPPYVIGALEHKPCNSACLYIDME